MKKIINKEILEYLAELARIELDEKKEKKMIKDLEEILDYFEEIKNVDTSKIASALSGAETVNVIRKDETLNKDLCEKREKLTSVFPEKENGFLKVPGVFE
ncbi:MAG: Aspartyl/glutamyl-tRNA(Asn/Gln) amidotransferase subunit C [Candidatus Wolfebacteria bacterium GW2011_GWA2_42_10]|uniref:Aspartyl/glutamyl-tRNA(Asn/Gln) amidotransferase subunit C n=2 Tax=Candidatus Wolfeibacteriota TaxID=1752735 RepID=A0A0G0XLD7_9BACT|nr:MAG: Aspartyl/glutamyl-tRNA(Asn/Gln) amidotransferase subunit C [Candidatus Wolfebacteria bacterium GW2011_GWB1_41_12]KKS25689.1 MAG: Aspartyl/glutamyl-tRNA(Asn/Gln) amidotransferase subunit C [Candidatus Wolfebacteria bacterium GW2011_GWA2_42_10]KKT56378.1 MAG: Aspartyl/glutamyl-tRNA(Asn/Gln) amidotransferase subunit C [Candidatus Wolfebacteria bacterium GW2011_GWA1_44_24]